MEKKRLKFLLLGTGIVATMGFLLAVGIGGSGGFAYYVTVSEFMAHGVDRGDHFRINGKELCGRHAALEALHVEFNAGKVKMLVQQFPRMYGAVRTKVGDKG